MDNSDLKLVLGRIKAIENVISDKDLAPILGLTSADFSNRKKRGTLLPLIFEWALENSCDLNDLFRGQTGQVTNIGVKRYVRPVYKLTGTMGPENWLSDQTVDEILLSDEFGKDVAIIKMSGNSMEPTIGDAGIFAVDCSVKSFVSGQVFVLWLPQEGPVLRRVFINLEGVTLRADNRTYPEIVFPADLPKRNDFILGRVRWVLQNV